MPSIKSSRAKRTKGSKEEIAPMQNQSYIIEVEECEIPAPPSCPSSWHAPEGERPKKRRSEGSSEIESGMVTSWCVNPVPDGFVSSSPLTGHREERHEIDAITAEAIAYAVANVENQYEDDAPLPEAAPSSAANCVTPSADKKPVTKTKPALEAAAFAVAKVESQSLGGPTGEATPSSAPKCVTPASSKEQVADLKAKKREQKKEPDGEFRKYGDRVLLARQAPNGMMKLGGGNCALFCDFALPTPDAGSTKGSCRDGEMRHACCSNDSWNPFGPTHAGDPVAALSAVPVLGRPFSLFIKRSLQKGSKTLVSLGFEYCGEYAASPIQDDDESLHHEADKALGDANKAYVVDDLQRSLRKPMGQLYSILDRWRERLAGAPAAIKPERGGNQSTSPSLLARARALGYHPEISDHDLAEIIANLNEFYALYNVRFLHYDEEIYDFVKEGESTRNIRGGARERDESGEFLDPPLLAKNWYELCDA